MAAYFIDLNNEFLRQIQYLTSYYLFWNHSIHNLKATIQTKKVGFEVISNPKRDNVNPIPIQCKSKLTRYYFPNKSYNLPSTQDIPKNLFIIFIHFIFGSFISVPVVRPSFRFLGGLGIDPGTRMLSGVCLVIIAIVLKKKKKKIETIAYFFP